MTERSIDHDLVADLYDCYVLFRDDVEFFLSLARQTDGPVLELMCGTGRLSLPLAKAGIRLVCVDYAPRMMGVLRRKLQLEGLEAGLVCQDVRRLSLRRSFPLVLLPFHSFSELVERRDQEEAMHSIFNVTAPSGRFVCTLHNPVVRIKGIGPEERVLGRFKGPREGTEVVLSSWSVLDRETSVVEGMQRIEMRGQSGEVLDVRQLRVRFALPGRDTVEAMASAVGFQVERLFGSYAGAEFSPQSSPYLIWIFRRPDIRR